MDDGAVHLDGEFLAEQGFLLSGLRLAAGHELRYPANISFRGPRELWVDWA